MKEEKEILLKEVKFTLKTILAKKGIKMKELSEKTGISQTHLSNLNTDRAKELSKKNIAKICTVLDCDISDLIEVVDIQKKRVSMSKLEKVA